LITTIKLAAGVNQSENQNRELYFNMKLENI